MTITNESAFYPNVRYSLTFRFKRPDCLIKFRGMLIKGLFTNILTKVIAKYY